MKRSRALSFAEQTSLVDDPTGVMPIRLLGESAGADARWARRTRLTAPHASCVLPLGSSVVDATLVPTATAHTLDKSAWLLLPAKTALAIRSRSPTAQVLVLGISEALIERVASTYGAEIDPDAFHRFLATASVLPRTNWVNEVAHRYLFERSVCKKRETDAARFLETELGKELYFLCREQHGALARPSLLEGRSDLMARALAHVDAHLFEPDVVASLSRACGASQSTLLRAFRREVGDGPLGYVRARRLDESLLLLKSRKHRVGEIASLVGYTSLPAFSQAFRARFGLRPSEVVSADERSRTTLAGRAPAAQSRVR